MATLNAPTIRLRHPETKIPNGMNIILKITLHDNLGNEFSHSFQDTSLLRYKLSRKEDIDVNFGSNFTVAVSKLLLVLFSHILILSNDSIIFR